MKTFFGLSSRKDGKICLLATSYAGIEYLNVSSLSSLLKSLEKLSKDQVVKEAGLNPLLFTSKKKAEKETVFLLKNGIFKRKINIVEIMLFIG